jgi:1-acyl-sn-glycerol-3-phosphate acyltransferase
MLISRHMNFHSAFVAARALIFIPLVTAAGSATAIVLSCFIRDAGFFHRRIARPCSRMILWLADVSVTVSGLENLPQNGQSCITVFNHQSHMDIPLLAYALPLELRFIGKKELRRIPFFGPAIIRMGHFLIDRKDRRGALEELKLAGDSVSGKSVSLAFAPEGTRSPDGRLLPFKKGAFVMSIATGLPILPVTIQGTFDRLPKGSLIAHPGSVHVTIHPQVYPAGMTYDDRDLLTENVRKIIEKQLNLKVG